MSNKFRTRGYHPIRKLKVILSGLHVAVVTDFSVAYKVILSSAYPKRCFFLSTMDRCQHNIASDGTNAYFRII